MTLLELAPFFALQNRNWGSRFHDLPKVTRLELRFCGSWPPRSCSFIYPLSTKSNSILCNISVLHDRTSCWRLHLSRWTEHVCTEHMCKDCAWDFFPHYLRTENILGQTEFWQTQKPKFVSSWKIHGENDYYLEEERWKTFLFAFLLCLKCMFECFVINEFWFYY